MVYVSVDELRASEAPRPRFPVGESRGVVRRDSPATPVAISPRSVRSPTSPVAISPRSMQSMSSKVDETSESPAPHVTSPLDVGTMLITGGISEALSMSRGSASPRATNEAGEASPVGTRRVAPVVSPRVGGGLGSGGGAKVQPESPSGRVQQRPNGGHVCAEVSIEGSEPSRPLLQQRLRGHASAEGTEKHREPYLPERARALTVSNITQAGGSGGKGTVFSGDAKPGLGGSVSSVHDSHGGEVAKVSLPSTPRRGDDVQRTVPILSGIGTNGGALPRIKSIMVHRVDAFFRPAPIEIPSELATLPPMTEQTTASAGRDRSGTHTTADRAVMASSVDEHGAASPAGGGLAPQNSAMSADSAGLLAAIALQTPADALARMRGVRRDVESTLEATYSVWEEATAASIASAHRERDLVTLHARIRTSRHPERSPTGNEKARTPTASGSESLAAPASSPGRVGPHDLPHRSFLPMTDAAIAVERARAEAVLSKSLHALRSECVAREWYAAAFEVDARLRIAREIVAVALASAATRSLSSALAQLAGALTWMVGRRVATAVRAVDAAAASARTLMDVLKQVGLPRAGSCML